MRLLFIMLFILCVPGCATKDALYRKHQVHMYTKKATIHCWYCEQDAKFLRGLGE